MNKNKLFLIGLVCSLLFSSFLSSKNVKATDGITELNNNDMETATEIASRLNSSLNFGKIITKDSIKLGKYDIEFYVEFENPEFALKEFVKKHYENLSYIQSKLELDNISMDNFKLYYGGFFEVLNEIDCPFIENHEVISEFKEFYDIFENTEENNRILNMVNDISLNTISLRSLDINQNDELVELSLNLPYYSNLYLEVNEKFSETNVSTLSTRALTGTSLSNALSYASKYYSSPNTYNYYYFDGNDCANFASQILEASGRSQVSSSSTYSGWWHKITYPYETFYPEYDPGAPVHEHSRSWTLADGFAKYFGIYNTYTTITSLSNNVKVGDFIVEDVNGDGNYNHVGFVTAKDTSALSYKDEQGVERTYVNFQVTQHSDNYRAYVSSTVNGWEYFSKGERVAIVRV